MINNASFFFYEAPARSPRAIATLGLLWAALAFGWLVMDAETWIVAIIAVLSLPALWEIVSGRVGRLTLNRTALHWQGGRHTQEVPLSQIDHVRLDRRFDTSMRVTLRLTDGARLRLPPDCVPPHVTFEAALQEAGVRTERHPFSLF